MLGLTRLPRAQVMVTTNGGTLWRNVPVIYSQTALFAAYSVSQQAGAALMGSYQPGTLLSVMADPSGRYVWAVGAQPWAVAVPSPGCPATQTIAGCNGNCLCASGTPPDLTNPNLLSDFGMTHVVKTAPFGTIIASTDSGNTWALQQPPLMTQYYNYALLDLWVVKSSSVVAVGGSLNNPQAIAYSQRCLDNGVTVGSTANNGECDAYDVYLANGGTGAPTLGSPSIYIGPGYGNGVITVTDTGGYSWALATYPGSTLGTAPTFTCVTFNGVLGMVGGYVYAPGPLQDNNGAVQYTAKANSATFQGIPWQDQPLDFGTANLNGQQQAGPAPSGPASFFPYVTATYPVNGTNLGPGTNVVQGLSYTLLFTTDPTRRSWSAYPAQALPQGFVAVGDPTTGYIPAGVVAMQPSIFGIVWDRAGSGTATHGWMYGYSVPIPGFNNMCCGGNAGAVPPTMNCPLTQTPLLDPPSTPYGFPCMGATQTMGGGFILRTYNGGASWDYETPYTVQADGLAVTALINIPAV